MRIDLTDVDEEVVAFLEAPAPAPLDPVVAQLQEFTEEMARVAENVAYRSPPPPAPTYKPQPSEVVVRVEKEEQGGLGGGGIAGILFTLWLVYNMS